MDKLIGCLAPGEEIEIGNSLFFMANEGLKEFQFSTIGDVTKWEPMHEIPKPLFIPLNGEYYDAFERGDKTDEYRAYGPRWNVKTCYPGREVILSRGYGKKNRMLGMIVRTTIVPPTENFIKIYGEGKQCFAISIINLRKLS